MAISKSESRKADVTGRGTFDIITKPEMFWP